MDNESVKKGLQVFGVVLGFVCIGGAVWSMCGPDADAPLTPVEKQHLKQQESLTGVSRDAAPVDASLVKDASDAG